MTVMVALLRGINVGGRNRLPMADLRRIVEGCGYTDVRTYIQSGNVVFGVDDGSGPDTVAETLAAAIATGSAVAPDVMVRTADELADIVAHSPFVDRTDDLTKLHVGFAGSPLPRVEDIVDPASFLPEEMAVHDRQLYLYFPFGMGRSPLAIELGKRKGGPSLTVRNWRTVTRLLDMVSAS